LESETPKKKHNNFLGSRLQHELYGMREKPQNWNRQELKKKLVRKKVSKKKKAPQVEKRLVITYRGPKEENEVLRRENRKGKGIVKKKNEKKIVKKQQWRRKEGE